MGVLKESKPRKDTRNESDEECAQMRRTIQELEERLQKLELGKKLDNATASSSSRPTSSPAESDTPVCGTSFASSTGKTTPSATYIELPVTTKQINYLRILGNKLCHEICLPDGRVGASRLIDSLPKEVDEAGLWN
jgi:hypothetical protein